MNSLIKTLNRWNGNLCFVGDTEPYGSVIFECDRSNGSIQYAIASKPITDICQWTANTYFVAFGESDLGGFGGGVLKEAYLGSGASAAYRIDTDRAGNIYSLDTNLNLLYKKDAWVIDLPDDDLSHNSDFMVRESDGEIIYWNNSSLYIIRDYGTEALVVNSILVGSAAQTRVLISNEFNPVCTYIGYRQVFGEELDYPSSSTSESSFSSTSSSTSSFGYSESSSTSSLGYSESSSTSSLGYSESSSQSVEFFVLYAKGFDPEDEGLNGRYEYDGDYTWRQVDGIGTLYWGGDTPYYGNSWWFGYGYQHPAYRYCKASTTGDDPLGVYKTCYISHPNWVNYGYITDDPDEEVIIP
jgi:hypothetical protein